MPTGLDTSGHFACFDLDWTLIRSVRSLFPKDSNDLDILPNRKTILQSFIDKRYTIIVFTNQKSKSEKEKQNKLDRINNFIKLIDLPITIFMATGEDEYRKPNIGMYSILKQMCLSTGILSSFYVGDAGGLQQDFSSDDINFAKNCGMKYYRPEEIFPSVLQITTDINISNINKIDIDTNIKNMVIFMGVPGSGKTSYYTNNLYSLGFIHINRDKLKTNVKVLKLIKDTLNNGLSMAIDATNPELEKRNEYYNLAQQYGYAVTVLYFVGNGYEWNKLREHPVPKIAYYKYYKNLVEPTSSNTPGKIYQIV